MELEKLDKALDLLDETISQFPLGAYTRDDYKPVEEKILDIRESLTALNARSLTLKAIINYNGSTDVRETESDLRTAFEKLNENTSNFLISKKAISICHQSQGIQDIIYKNKGSPEIQAKVKSCLKKLFMLNDKLMVKNEKRKELLKKQYQLRFKSHEALYDYNDFLKEKEARINQQLQEDEPNVAELKERINRSINKICIMKKLITNLIAAMCEELYKNPNLVDMLAKHKHMVTYDTIKELAQNEMSK